MLMKAVYIFLVALISVLLAVTCVSIVIMARRPKKKKNMNKFKTGIRNNRVFCRTSDDIREQSLIMKAGKSMECIEDM